MTHLRIEQNTTGIEEVSASIISKLYELAYAGLDASSNLQGRLHSTAAYEYQISYLTQNYPNLFITADKSYLYFQDPEVERVLATKFGDGTGVTSLNMAGVTALGDQVFTSNTTVQTFDELVNFPNITSFTTFGGFSRCTNLRSVDLSNIQHIGGETLLGCSSLAGVLNLPAIVSLGDSTRGSALNGCSSLTEIHFGPNFTTITGWYNINNCTSLTTVTGLENFVNIPPYTFKDDTALQTVDISGAKIIGQYAFNNCGNLTDIGELSGKVQIGRDAFTNDTKLQQSCIDNVEVMLDNDANGNVGGQFGSCHGLTEITLSTDCTNIGSWTFYNCSNLERINNTSQITRIGPAAFNQCVKLTSLDLSNLDTTNSGVQTAFATDSPYDWNNGLFTWDAELTTLGRSIFPDITKLGQRSFIGCTKLAGSLIFPDLTTEGREIFQDCRALEYVYLGHIQTLQANNIYNRHGEFLNCENLKAVYLGDSITNLSLYQFAGCTQLRAVIINNTTVPGYNSNGNDTPTDPYVTRNDMLGNSVCLLYVPDSAVATYKTTYPWSKFPDAVKPISEYPGSLTYNNFTYTGS